MDKYHEILNLIKTIRDSFPNSEKVYTQGSCFQFALILKTIYPDGDIYWNADHAVFEYKGHFYDITGEVDGRQYTIKIEDWGILHINKILKLRYTEPQKF